MEKYISSGFKRSIAFCIVGWLVYEIGLVLYLKLEHESGRGDIFAFACLLCGFVILHGLGRFAAAAAFKARESIFASRLSGGAGCIFAAGVVGALSALLLVLSGRINSGIIILTAGAIIGILGSVSVFRANIEK